MLDTSPDAVTLAKRGCDTGVTLIWYG